ncbi:DMT family transporter [Celeribacter sp.]|uniref:DMT family transporter n=1 Tax=Celeribacter sp. TaxID=1890673 RepID=UPI003A903FBD
MPTSYIYLICAIFCEVVGTTALPATQQFTRLLPSLLAVASYAIAIYFLTLAIATLPVGIVYAIWSGLGIVFISVVSLFLYGQKLDIAAIIGMGLIISGVVVIHLFSKMTH